MQISLKWINELVNIESINLDSLIDKLTLGGFEVEEILKIEIENQTYHLHIGTEDAEVLQRRAYQNDWMPKRFES